jgi:MoaA/NifB/PqqE/SkfB family radical SAM enzyme
MGIKMIDTLTFLPKERAPEYLRLRINDKLNYEDLLEFPSYVYLDVTADCNASCRMCTFAHNENRFMSDELFDKASKEIIENKKYVKYVVVQGRGEPLLDPKIYDRVALFSKENGISTFMSTNASLLDESTARHLLEGKITTIVMSIDSLKKDVYEKIRYGLSFDVVLENILRFIRLRDEINPDTQVRIRMVEQKPNMGEWDEFEAYWKPKLKSHDRLTVKKVHAWGGKLKISDTKNITTDQDFFPCVALWSFFSILSDGNIPLCPGDGAVGNYSLGNLCNANIKELWKNSIERNAYRNSHLLGNKEPSEMCKNCRMMEEPSDFGHIGKQIFPELYEN